MLSDCMLTDRPYLRPESHSTPLIRLGFIAVQIVEKRFQACFLGAIHLQLVKKVLIYFMQPSNLRINLSERSDKSCKNFE